MHSSAMHSPTRLSQPRPLALSTMAELFPACGINSHNTGAGSFGCSPLPLPPTVSPTSARACWKCHWSPQPCPDFSAVCLRVRGSTISVQSAGAHCPTFDTSVASAKMKQEASHFKGEYTPTPTLAPPWPHPGPTLAPPWPHPGPTLAQPGPTLAPPWPNPAQPGPTRPHPGPTLAQPWPNPGPSLK
ncbi:chitin-binding lectin 1-like [Colossoma macropomum]|uniref:chitin-binding lectin 1-like n=1 Tax=Colossoma macropomum TaxID=42526 RepID=UPI001864F2BC|nr:chitin-binding lectin 1-like [Colossoma macropomum]